jgi:hypothetical protein
VQARLEPPLLFNANLRGLIARTFYAKERRKKEGRRMGRKKKKKDEILGPYRSLYSMAR